jgi:kumamolisin
VTRPIPSRIRRAATLVGATVLAAAIVNPPAALASGPTTTVTILLKAPDPARLAKLAMATGDNHGQRLRQLASALPGAAAHQTVRSALTSAGFDIGHETAWTINASAPQSIVDATFGTLGALTGTTAHDVVADLPASIAGVASAVLDDTSASPLFSTHATLDGPDFRNAYAAPLQSPSEGRDKNGNLTIASLQFANWNDVDLSKYAAQPSVNIAPDPVASGQYKQFAVAASKISPATPDLDEEVDLDQEALLSTAPHANERAYFDTNSSGGYVQALSQVLADVTQGQGKSADGGDPHIAALTTSWGACEDDFTSNFPGDSIKAVEALLQALDAAGVTVFAASGDDGIYDCGRSKTSTKVAVDYPASSPEVVGVGATRLTSIGGSAANDGTNWSDRGWTCTDPASCESSSGSGGSGGGESDTFAIPAYQSSGIGNGSFTTSAGKRDAFAKQPRRLVPDIAVNGDPATGFQILTTDQNATCKGQLPLFCNPLSNPATLTVGGTSLSAPIAAALFTNMLGAHGATSGVGDIHGALYSAYAGKPDTFRDVTAGSNGAQADADHAATTLPVKAGKGYDTVSGLGAPLWPSLAPYVFSPKAPAALAAIALADPHDRKKATNVLVHWHPANPGVGALLASSASVTIKHVGAAAPVYTSKTAPTTGSYRFTGVAGGTYVVTVTEYDSAGKHAAAVRQVLAVPYDDTTFRLSGSWRTVAGSADYAGSHIETSAKGAAATATARGTTYELFVRTGPTYGKLSIFQGKKHIGTYDLFSSAPAHTTIPFFGGARTPARARTFTFRCAGVRGTFSSGTTVALDGLAVTR